MLLKPVIDLLKQPNEDAKTLFSSTSMTSTIERINNLVDKGLLTFDFYTHTIIVDGHAIELPTEIVNELQMPIRYYHAGKKNTSPCNIPLSLGGTTNSYLTMKISVTKTIFINLWSYLKNSSEEENSHKQAI
mgnify:CR=1 FL=1